jgi:SNF2 family DNA or RNA helicase
VLQQSSPRKTEAEIEEAAKTLRIRANEPLILSPTGEVPAVQVDPQLTRKLMDYQRDGVAFLYRLYRANTGGILADDMGLGKSAQAIAFVSAILGPALRRGTIFQHFPKFGCCKEEKSKDEDTAVAAQEPPKSPPVLIVVPAGVIEQWIREFERWLKLSVDVFHGQDRKSTL